MFIQKVTGGCSHSPIHTAPAILALYSIVNNRGTALVLFENANANVMRNGLHEDYVRWHFAAFSVKVHFRIIRGNTDSTLSALYTIAEYWYSAVTELFSLLWALSFWQFRVFVHNNTSNFFHNLLVKKRSTRDREHLYVAIKTHLPPYLFFRITKFSKKGTLQTMKSRTQNWISQLLKWPLVWYGKMRTQGANMHQHAQSVTLSLP